MKMFFHSMTSRVFLLLFVGVVLSTLLALGLALGERQRMIGQFRDFHAVERITQFVLSLETVPPDARRHLLNAVPGIGMRAEPAAASAGQVPRSQLAIRIGERLPDGYVVESTAVESAACDEITARHRAWKTEHRASCEAFLITLPDATRLHLTVLPPRTPPFAPRVDVLTYGALFLLGIAAVAVLATRMTIRPLRQLAQAATALGNDIERPPLPESGATEIRQAAAAFNAMQSRIRQHIRQRAQILAAITHDLQTPLTRLRLRLEKVDDAELREKLIGDLSAMQSMVREGLELARSMSTTEVAQRLDLDSLIDSVCVDAVDAGQSVSVSGKTQVSLLARPLALRRCLTNLIDNTVKYGRRAEVNAACEDGFAVIRIRDSGPGIPEAELEKVFEPFYRLENSRSRQTGGTGLGLTIARNIAEQHGGTIRLRNHPDGGLEVTLALPSQY